MPAPRPSVYFAIRPWLYDALFAQPARQQLHSVAELSFADGDIESSAQLAQQIKGHDIVISGWGTPVFDAEVLAAAHSLRLIAHSAGTIKNLLPPPVFADGRRVTHAAAAMGIPVGGSDPAASSCWA